MLAADHRRFVWAIFLLRGAAAAYASVFIALNYLIIRVEIYPLLIYTLPCLLGSAMLLWALLPARERVIERCPLNSPSLVLALRDICARAGVPAANRIEILFAVNAAAYTLKQESRVAVGFPLLATLTRAQVDAVVAHEVAHHLYGDTGSGRVSQRLDRLLERMVRLMSRRAPALILLPFRPVFLRLLRFVRETHRECEFHADEFAARTLGFTPYLDVLNGFSRIDALWAFFLDHWVLLVRTARVAIDLTSMYEAFLATGIAERIRVSPSSGFSGAYDTHPSIRERVERLRQADSSASCDENAEAGVGDVKHEILNPDVLSAEFYHQVLNLRATSFDSFAVGYPKIAAALMARFGPALAPFAWRDLDDLPRVFSQYSFASYQATGIDNYEFEKYVFVFLVSHLIFTRSGQPLCVGEYCVPNLTFDGVETDLWSIVSSQFGERDSRLAEVLLAVGIDPSERLIDEKSEG